jgi:hypothetical protein
MIPLYGFLEGDTLGLLLLAEEDETFGELARRLQESASLRVAPFDNPEIRHGGRSLPAECRVGAVGLTALDRIDVVRGGR